MEEKKHVGRPTNEEVANRKKKKVIKYSLITIVSVLLIGGIALFLNRDKLDFSSLMGASIFKRYNYVVNEFDPNDYWGYYIKITDSKISKVTKCSTTKSKYASCKTFNDGEGIFVSAKKSGNVTLKISAKNKKNRNVTKYIKVKIGKDFIAPTCTIEAKENIVKRGQTISAVVKCDESFNFLDDVTKNKTDEIGYTPFDLWNGYAKRYNLFVKKIKATGSKSYEVDLTVPNDVSTDSVYILGARWKILKDSSGNINTLGFNTKGLPWIKVY